MDASMTLREKLKELIRDRLIYASGIKTGDLFEHTAELTVENIFMFLEQDGFKKVGKANIPEPDSDMLMDLAGQDEFIAFQIYVKSIGKANPNGLFTEIK